MLRNIVGLIFASILVILGVKYFSILIDWYVVIYHMGMNLLKPIFSAGTIGVVISKVICIVTIPTLLGIVPSALYGLINHKPMPYRYMVIWILWTVLVSVVVYQH